MILQVITCNNHENEPSQTSGNCPKYRGRLPIIPTWLMVRDQYEFGFVEFLPFTFNLLVDHVGLGTKKAPFWHSLPCFHGARISIGGPNLTNDDGTRVIGMMGISLRYPLVNVYKKKNCGKSTHFKWVNQLLRLGHFQICSIATLVYQKEKVSPFMAQLFRLEK